MPAGREPINTYAILATTNISSPSARTETDNNLTTDKRTTSCKCPHLVAIL